MIVSYCERTGPGLWAEPFNVLTNLAFLLSAWLAWRSLKGRVGPGNSLAPYWDMVLLTVLIGLIALSSGIWHLTAIPAWGNADAVSIAAFVHLYLYTVLRRPMALSVPVSLLGVGLFLGVTVFLSLALPQDWLNGSLAYLPAWLGLVGLSWIQRRQPVEDAPGWAPYQASYPGSERECGATGTLLLFTVALVLRTLDLSTCEDGSLGTHFLWHLINAWVLWRLMQMIINNRKPWRAA